MSGYESIEGGEWQRQVCRWLRLRYHHNAKFDVIPDDRQGDWGIEGWSRDGRVYQCYSPQIVHNAKHLYNKHRDKMTRDIGKFIDNASSLEVVFDGVTIESWWYVIPDHRDKLLNKHAATLQNRVRTKRLAFCGKDFFIKIATPDDFEAERQMELHSYLRHINIPKFDPTEEEIQAVEQRNQDDCAVLRDKIQRMGMDDKLKNAAYSGWLRQFVIGNSILGHLRNEVPDTYTEIRRIIANHEKLLVLTPYESYSRNRLTELIDQLSRDVTALLPSLSNEDTTSVAYYALSEWLLRCPWDFPEIRNESR